ncbi:MAG: C39 family peptidase, partial [Ruminococcus sp.]|nr:C39 family peptidase [Ruminococcus sp.]
MKKNFFAVAMAILMCLLLCNLMPVSANGDAENTLSVDYATGGIWMPGETDEVQYSDQNISPFATYPESIDLSTNAAFPDIGWQGEMASCAGWATTYYQFTYEVNKIRNLSSKGEANKGNVYSPSWTYNYINGGINSYTNLYDAYAVLSNQGAMKLEDYPHEDLEVDYSFEWSTDIEKMTEALEYRAIRHSIYASSSAEISTIKEYLTNGYSLVVWTNSSGWTTRRNDDGQHVIVRGSSSGDGGHFMTVVGYDDNIQITVNGVTLTGALKLANSWGNTWGNDGYVWVSYDALNATSLYGTTWQESFTTSRTSVFGAGNTFHYIDVHHCDVTFAGYARYITKAPHNVNIYAQNGTTVTVDDNNKKYGDYILTLEKNMPTTRSPVYLVFDYFTLNSDGTYTGDTYNMANSLLSNWTVRIDDLSAPSTGGMLTRVLDNFGNVIAPPSGNHTALTNGTLTLTTPVNLAKGRVTAYDNGPITSEDSAMVLDYTIELIEFSNVQAYLADYNSDGVISTLDVIEMNQAIAAQSGQSYAITDYIEEWGCSLADVI